MKIFEEPHPWANLFEREPTLSDENNPSLLEPPTTMVATQNVTKDPSSATVSFRFAIAPAPVPFGLAAVPAPLHPPAVAAAPDSVAPDTADVEVAGPRATSTFY